VNNVSEDVMEEMGYTFEELLFVCVKVIPNFSFRYYAREELLSAETSFIHMNATLN